MANKNKNNKSGSTHRHVFKKRKLPGFKRKVRPTSDGKIEGSRIINLEKLRQYTDELSAHSSRCMGAITLTGENRNGLA